MTEKEKNDLIPDLLSGLAKLSDDELKNFKKSNDYIRLSECAKQIIDKCIEFVVEQRRKVVA